MLIEFKHLHINRSIIYYVILRTPRGHSTSYYNLRIYYHIDIIILLLLLFDIDNIGIDNYI